MKMTPEMIAKIQNEVFGNKEWPFLSERLRMLYEKALELVSPEEEDAVLAEIKELERSQRRDIVRILNLYENITPENMISDYSKSAYLLAKKHLDSGCSSLLAQYMHKVFFDMIRSPDFNKITESPRYRKIISESLLDYNYAAGKSEIMSFRLGTEASS